MKNIGLLDILTIIFVLLKVFGVISWSWFIVFLPTIISVVGALLILLIATIIAYAADK